MRFLFVALALTAHCVSALHLPQEEIYRNRALRVDENINEYFDKVFKKLGEFLVNQGLDPMAAPDITRELSFKDLLGITWHGGIILTNGWVSDLSVFSRYGDAIVEYDHKMMRIKVVMAFNDILVQYNWKAEIMNIGPTGTAIGTLKNAKVLIDIIADLETMELFLQDMKITDAGQIDLEIHGKHGLLDLLVNAITDVVNFVFHDLVLNVLNKEVRPIVDMVVKDIDLGEIIGNGGGAH